MCGGCGMPQSSVSTGLVFSVLPTMLEKLKEVSDFEGKSGGIFCLMDQATGELVIEPTEVGEITNGKKERYTEVCLEKAARLRENEEHLLSWQSRNVSESKWGGAINDGVYIWSFSGLSEPQDEALMLTSAHQCGRVANGFPRECAMLSGNQIILNNDNLFWVTRH